MDDFPVKELKEHPRNDLAKVENLEWSQRHLRMRSECDLLSWSVPVGNDELQQEKRQLENKSGELRVQ